MEAVNDGEARRPVRYVRCPNGNVWRLSIVAGWQFAELATAREGWLPLARDGQPRAVRMRLGMASKPWWPLPGERVNRAVRVALEGRVERVTGGAA